MDIWPAQVHPRAVRTPLKETAIDDDLAERLKRAEEGLMDDRQRAEAQLGGEKQLLEMIASGRSLPDILTALCNFVKEMAGCHCGVYQIDWSGPIFTNAVAPSLPTSYIEPMEGWPVRRELAPCGIAANDRTQVIVEDISTDPRWAATRYEQHVLAHGLRSVWSTPIYSRDGQVLGTFCVYQSEPGLPTLFQLDLIAQVTHIASIAIERASSEAALTRSERELKLIVDTIPAMAWSARPDGTGEFFNQHYLDYVGLSLEQARDWGWTTALHPDDREGLVLTWQRIRASAQSGEGEMRLRRRDGEYRWFLFRVSPVRDESGRLVKWYGINIDITERKLALERLQSNQDLLDLAQKSAGAMAFDWYIQQEINYWSPEQEALFGLAPGGFDGTYKSWKKMMYAPDWPMVVAAIQHAHQTGKVTAEYRVVWPDGSLHWLSTNGRMFFDDAGQPLRMVGFTSDVTRRKNVEEELRRNEAFLRQAQHLSRTGSFSWRVATDEITWSEQLYRIYELEPGLPVTPELIRTRVHPEDLTLYEKMLKQARNGSDDFEWQYRLLMPDQSIKYLHAVARATRDQNGQLEYIAAVQDVTARRLSQEALDKARLELTHVARVMSLGALTASIAHEVNQPLSGIITNASTCKRMLEADPPNVEGARETVRRTIRDGHRAADVITRLRALFSKKDAATELVDLNEATLEVIALLRSELERSGVTLQTELAEDLTLVTGDRVQLQQVILNLLRNASDAMSGVHDRPRQLTLRTEREDGHRVRLSVKDAGTGFEPDNMNKLFEAFYTTKSEGMGIGLSVSRSIIENHHGRLSAAPNDGPGATFSFSIPGAAGSVAGAASPDEIAVKDKKRAARSV
jgi:PAS domain S-box-containing protein